MEQLSKRLKVMAPSATMEMNQRSRDLIAKGVDVINLSVGEPDFPTPNHIKEAAIKAINDNFTFYPPATGYNDLREAIVDKFSNENQLEYSLNQILVTVGAKNALAYALMCLVDADDEVIVPAPYWVTYAELVKISEGKNVIIDTTWKSDFKINASQLEAAITPKTKVLLLCSPSNPSGAVYSKDELELLKDVLVKYPDIFIITDEIYEHINFVGKHTSLANFPDLKERVIVINGVSKAYAMTGWRIGYMAGPEWFIKAATKLQGQILTGPTTIAMKAAEAALRSDQSFVQELKSVFERRRDLVVSKLKQIPGIKMNIPEGAFYVFPNISSFYCKSYEGKTIENSTDFCLYLLDKAHVGTVPGDAFGNDNCFRISYATADEKLIIALDRIIEALKLLK